MASEQIVQLTAESFDTEVLKSGVPVLVDFWAPWCGPCRMVAPILDQLAEDYEGKIKIAKLNVDDFPQVAGHYGVMSIPTLICFKDGQLSQKVVGARGKPELKTVLDGLL